MQTIKQLAARRILDSRGTYTIETQLRTEKGVFVAAIPKGASTGSLEALELPAVAAVENVNRIIVHELIGKPLPQQSELDALLLDLDGTAQKSKLGANAILSVSLAGFRANAFEEKKEAFEFVGELAGNKKFVLPIPFLNVLNGGKHAGLEFDVQETMIVPHRFASYGDAIEAGVLVFHALRKLLHQKWGASATLVGDEGGFVPSQAKNLEQRLELLEQAVEESGFKGKVSFAVDAAASEFFDAEKNNYRLGEKQFSSEELVDYYASIAKNFDVVSIEDGLDENDWKGWSLLTQKLGKKLQVVGDDLLVTNSKRIKTALETKACNALLLKPNQIGSVSEAIAAGKLALDSGWKVMVSHRSGETNDDFIADLAVGLGAGQCKFGAPDRGERVAKFNRLLEIEQILGGKAVFGRL